MSISIDNFSSYIDQAKKTSAGSDLQSTLSGDLSSASDEELMDVCKDFEAYFIEQILKEAEKTVDKQEGDSSASQLTDFYKDTVRQEMAMKIGEQGGNSFAQMMYEQMKRNYDL